MTIRAGAAMVDITPEMGTQIAGDIGRHRPVEEIREPTYARALVLECGGQRCAIVALDVATIDQAHAAQIRAGANRRFSLEPEAVLIHATQTHAAPAVGNFMISERIALPHELWFIRGGDNRYHPMVVEGVLAALEDAIKGLQPVTMQAGRATDGRVAFNRRFIMRDGTARTHPFPLGSPDILYCEGPVDPEVSVLTFTNGAGEAVAALLHHTCHPVHGYPQRWVSSGWPGAWAQGVCELLGTQCVPLVLNGMCGNIHHTNHLDPDYVDDYHAMGRKLTQTTARILGNLESIAVPGITCRSRTLPIPYRELSAEQIAADEAYLAMHPEPVWLDRAAEAIEWEWIYANARKDLRLRREERPEYPFELQAIRLGDVAILGVEGEPFVEAQLDIKETSPARYTIGAHMANGCAGYIPTKRALARGGYETRPGTWSMLCADGLEMMTAAAKAMLDDLFTPARK